MALLLLPDDVLRGIFSWLSLKELISIDRVSRRARALSLDLSRIFPGLDMSCIGPKVRITFQNGVFSARMLSDDADTSNPPQSTQCYFSSLLILV
jgi:hypothetical protein